MTRVAIACPGPSLLHTWQEPDVCDPVLAINGAAALVACDWWCVGDAEVLSWYPQVIPLIGVYHQDTWWRRFRRDLIACHEMHWDEIRCEPPHHGSHWSTTLPAAIALAARLGATHVDLYGCDWSGGDYAPGVIARDGPADSRQDRWKRERRETQQATIATQIIITRHLPKDKS
jgi:hypothetical protein